ncbi:hypothetical protein, partial [Peribacillus faecalis]|uniref:hypothetical protein n=1 Tax=Peribacillus faecalis TaxID=2772559 RepID=UPI0019D6E320
KIQLILTGISHLFDSNGIAILRKTEKNKEKPYFIEGVYILNLDCCLTLHLQCSGLSHPIQETKTGFLVRFVLVLPHCSFFIEDDSQEQNKNEKGPVTVFLIKKPYSQMNRAWQQIVSETSRANGRLSIAQCRHNP